MSKNVFDNCLIASIILRILLQTTPNSSNNKLSNSYDNESKVEF